MANPRKQEVERDRADRSNGDDFDDLSSVSSGVESSTVGSGRVSRERGEIGLTERLTDIFVEHGDGDLLLQRSDREDRVLQWLQALDMQVMGACRADERLKPLLKIHNASNGLAEDPLLAHLSQHFEPSEVGMLARCFCIPLVSIRVGKINKHGTLLYPTATRGNLTLTLLPTSDLRLSFIGDDGNSDTLCTLSTRTQCSSVAVDEIPADSSGKSFLIKIPDNRVFYFWCSEKSKLLGIELLSKMKDVLKRKPSIAELTGISKSRLNCFATHLRAYLVGNNAGQSSAYSPASSATTTFDPSDASTSSLKSLRARHCGSQVAKSSSPFQGSLSPRSSSFKEGLPRSLSSLRNAAREKLRRRGDCHLSAVDNLVVPSPQSDDASGSEQLVNEKLVDDKSCKASSFLESFSKLVVPTNLNNPTSHDPPASSPPFTPHYCLCPQGELPVQSPSSPLQLPTSGIEFPLLPPISSFLSAGRPAGLLAPTASLGLADIPSLDFPALLPDPLVRLPMPSAQQIPTFTPLMCDPIVHIPVIDVCSSGQGYLVSTGPTISPLHPKLVNPLISETDAVVENGARETLRLLLSGSSQTSPQLKDIPAVLTNPDEKQTSLVVGSRGLYAGSRDVNAITNSIATMGLVTFSESSMGDFVAKMRDSCTKLDELQENHHDIQGGGSSGSRSDGSFSEDEEDSQIINAAREGTK